MVEIISLDSVELRKRIADYFNVVDSISYELSYNKADSIVKLLSDDKISKEEKHEGSV